MKLRFTKMQGAGNDFVVLDATRGALPLSAALIRRLGDRRFGVGADQVLVVERAQSSDVDFRYRIFNGATGQEVEHCGNGARCFVRFARDHGLIDRDVVRVETVNNRLELRQQDDGRVTVDMNAPIFELQVLPFDAQGLVPQAAGSFELWPLILKDGQAVDIAVLSMGNPHAVLLVSDVDAFDVQAVGPQLESHPRFARRVNAGFLEVIARSEVKLRVYERNAGETLACGTGACAAVVAGIRLGWLDERVDVHTRGGRLTIEWPGVAQGLQAHVLMTGPAETVFEGEISL
jgi:diaminopimelate epimerase